MKNLLIILSAGVLIPITLEAQSNYPRTESLTRITRAYPAISPDGTKFAFMSNADGDFDIYVMSMGKRELGKLTNTDMRDGIPVWSPDGKKIAFQSFRDGNSQVYVMNADGSNQVNLSNNGAHEEHPFWSSDGSKILFVSNRGGIAEGDSSNIDIYEMNSDGSNVKRITNTPTVETYASWSPDESKIVCRKITEDGNWEVFMMNSDGTNEINLTNSELVQGWPAWSPDGKRIAYASEISDQTIRIFIMNSDGSNKIRISDDNSGGDRQPFWHPNGKALAFSRYDWFRGHPWYEQSKIVIVGISE